MAFVGQVFVTPHARRRWRERINKGASDEQALGEILAALGQSRLTRTDDNGTQHWRASGQCRFGRVRIRVRPGLGPLPAVVTVLAEHDRG